MSTFLLKFIFADQSPSKFLQGPRSPNEVKRRGYSLTEKEEEAWTFSTRKQAENKARILYIHMGHGAGDAQSCAALAQLHMFIEVIEKGGPTETVPSKPLFIPLKGGYFEDFEQGRKSEEYRPYGPRWNEHTCPLGRPVVLSLGYGRARRLTGRISAFQQNTNPGQLHGWNECYGTRHPVAAVIGITLDTPA